MPYKSEAQRRKLKQLAAEGKFPMEKIREYDKASEGLDLPERVEKPARKYVKVIR